MNDRKHLKLRHNTWYFQKRVPKALKALYPDRDIIEQSLETGDIREAREKRDILLGQLRQRERLLKVQEQPRQRFLQYVDQLSQVAGDRFVGPGSCLGLNFTHVADTSYKCQRGIPMDLFERHKGSSVFNP